MPRLTLLRAAAVALPLLAAPAALAAAPAKPAAAPAAKPATAPAAKPATEPAAKPATAAAKPVAGSVPAGWSAVDAQDAGFSAAYPGAVSREPHVAGNFQMVVYGFESERPERSFMAMAVFGDALAGRMLDEVVVPNLQEGGQVVKDEAATLDGRPTRAFQVRSEGSEMAFRRVTAYDRHYLLAVRVPAGQPFPAEDARAFFDSFRFRAEVTIPEDLALDPEGEEDEEEDDEDFAFADEGPPAALPPARAAQGFKAFQAEDAGFAVKFPGEPKREEDDASIDYEVTGDDGTCSFSVLTFRQDGDVPPLALDLFVSEMAEKFGRGVTRNEKVTVAGLDGRAISVALADERIEARILRSKRNLYVLLVGGTGATPPQGDLDAFFGSFRVIE